MLNITKEISFPLLINIVKFAAKSDNEKKNKHILRRTSKSEKKDAEEIDTFLKIGNIKNIGIKNIIEVIKPYIISKATSEMKYFLSPKGSVERVSNVPCFISLLILLRDLFRIFVAILTKTNPAKIKETLSTMYRSCSICMSGINSAI